MQAVNPGQMLPVAMARAGSPAFVVSVATAPTPTGDGQILIVVTGGDAGNPLVLVSNSHSSDLADAGPLAHVLAITAQEGGGLRFSFDYDGDNREDGFALTFARASHALPAGVGPAGEGAMTLVSFPVEPGGGSGGEVVFPVEPDGGPGGVVVFPVEPDGGPGGEVVFPVEPDGGTGAPVVFPVEPDGGPGGGVVFPVEPHGLHTGWIA